MKQHPTPRDEEDESESDDGSDTIREGGDNKDAWRCFILLSFSQEE